MPFHEGFIFMKLRIRVCEVSFRENKPLAKIANLQYLSLMRPAKAQAYMQSLQTLHCLYTQNKGEDQKMTHDITQTIKAMTKL